MAPTTLSLEGKTAIVTGSGRENGIGAAIALALARNGARVAINYVSDNSAARAAKVASNLAAVGAQALVVQADVSTPSGAAKLISDTLSGFQTDKIDILSSSPFPPFSRTKTRGTNPIKVNNAGAGTGQGKLLVDLTPEEVQTAFALNTFSTLYVAQAAAPHIPRGGRIVNIGTVVSRIHSMPGVGVYGASKAAQEYLTAALAAEVSRFYSSLSFTEGEIWADAGMCARLAGTAAGDYGEHGCSGSDEHGCCVVVSRGRAEGGGWPEAGCWG